MIIDIKAIRARADAATPGKWTACEDPTDGSLWVMGARPVRICDIESSTRSSTRLLEVGDVEFISGARTDVPLLCDEVERLTAENGRLKGLIKEAEWSSASQYSWSECPWCGGDLKDANKHPECPAFLPDGTAR